MKTLRLTQKEAEGFYAVHRERPFFKGLTEFMSSGPIVALVLEAPDAIKKWRTLMGATDPAKADAGTMRKEFASSIERERHAWIGCAGNGRVRDRLFLFRDRAGARRGLGVI